MTGVMNRFRMIFCGKDCKGWQSRFQSEAKEWNDSGTLKSHPNYENYFFKKILKAYVFK